MRKKLKHRNKNRFKGLKPKIKQTSVIYEQKFCSYDKMTINSTYYKGF